MENAEKEKTDKSQHFPQTEPPRCRFFSQGKHCHFGKKCKFLHVRDDAAAQEKKSNRLPIHHEGTPVTSEACSEDVGHTAVAVHRRPCRYYLSGHCAMEDRCRFWHPTMFPTLDDTSVSSVSSNQTRSVQRKPQVPRPAVLQEVKLCDLTEDVGQKLRETEIRQLMKRFPKDKVIIQERSDGKVTYYRMSVEATDPDWPFDLKEIDIMVSFPDSYPQEIFTLEIPLDQELPPVMAKHVQQASLEWLQAKHATNGIMGKVELLFRPFLRWLDRSLERLFTEGARQLKKDMDLEKAGLQFIPYQELQASVGESPDDEEDTEADTEDTNDGKLEETELQNNGGENGGKTLPSGEDEVQLETEAARLVENIKLSNPRRGTEVKVLGLRLGENTATVVAQQISVCFQCNRCKITADLTLSGRTACAAQCEKCSSSISAAFRPCMLHHYCDVLGYLDLHNVVPSDLVLQDCELIVGCLSCSQDTLLQNLSYGQTRELNCEHCHSKLSVQAESIKFHYLQPHSNKTGTSTVNYKMFRDPAVQKGKPLPDKGTCKHYKQSHRWLRFPCCGRAYACDACHDEDQDHPMELATRMLCGYCAKEQPYNNGKPCVSCGSMLTRGARTSHWEGGQGCRNKVKMARNDRHKYANTNKTVSRRAAGDKK
ncbi:uncharacterized protein LOC103379434 isoform X2 [Cynoglossus semilaevis]|uniref:Nucleoporin NUP42 n=2 Tax=Cynoglossus semilaevis TaxID=244447 RepID=A0A3P8W5F0_CYNSE|nr:uncharacterized protein LOC103379434 isoform X2 [Cynoglossus semilaevis]XP_008309206.1 uncharacterized protein LOC103379434 isoform X2 [Cynoglossus semilaevis]